MGTLNSPSAQTFLEAAGILHVTEVRSLKTKDVDSLLQLEGVRCIQTNCYSEIMHWLAPENQHIYWEQLKSELGGLESRDWGGWVEAWEWRTDSQEPIIEFMSCHVPI
jgi:hypothetical protein